MAPCFRRGSVFQRVFLAFWRLFRREASRIVGSFCVVDDCPVGQGTVSLAGGLFRVQGDRPVGRGTVAWREGSSPGARC